MDSSEVGGGTGMLTVFLHEAQLLQGVKIAGAPYYLVPNSDSLVEVSPKTDRIDEELFFETKGKLIEIVKKIKVEERTTGEWMFNFDNLYQRFYDAAQNSEIRFRDS